MLEYLCVDFGTKRIGLAYANDSLNIAVPLDAITEIGNDFGIAKICEIVQLRCIKKIIVGYPLNMDGTHSKMTDLVDVFIEKLKMQVNVDIIRQDERLTSFDAETVFMDLKKSKTKTIKSRKLGETDSKAAAIILQDFLDEKQLKFDTK